MAVRSELWPPGQRRPFDGSRRYLIHRLAEASFCSEQTLDEIAFALQEKFGRDFLEFLVEEGILSPIAAAAVRHLESGTFDQRDLKQVLPADWPSGRPAARFRRALASLQQLLYGEKERRRPIHLGTLLGQYWVRGLIGEGAHSDVYLALHPTLKHLVAIKVAHHHVLAKKRLQREAEVLAQLSHPNIVRLWDYQELDEVFLVEEWISGPSLLQKLRYEGPCPPSLALRIIQEVVKGLEIVWRKGFVHNDLKPSNLILTAEGVCKVTDFGVTERRANKAGFNERPGSAFVLSGTLNYAAPERFDGCCSWASDQYSLGLVLYELITGVIAFPGDKAEQLELAHKSAKPASMSEFAKDLPTEIMTLVDRMTAKSVEMRFASVEELAETLEVVEYKTR